MAEDALGFYQSETARKRVLGRKQHPAPSASTAAFCNLGEQDGPDAHERERRRLSLVGADVLRSAFTFTEEEGEVEATTDAAVAAHAASPRASRSSFASECDVSILFEGWLLFRRRQLKNWKQRWVALCCGGSFGGLGLQWFDLSSDRGTQGSVSGIIGCQIEESAPQEQGQPQHFTFSVQCGGLDGSVDSVRDIFLRAEHEEDMLQWVAAIEDGL